MCLSTIACFSAEAAFGFTVKNCCCYYGLDKVRTGLQQTITEIVKPQFGNFVAPLVGNQIGLMLAMPATLFYGEMMAFAIKKVISSIRMIVASLFYGIKEEKQGAPLFREVVMSIAAFTTGFFAKTYFCNYGMPYVGTALSSAAALATPVIGLSLPVVVLMPAIVVVITPAVTFAFGDFVAFTTNQTTYNLLAHSCRVVWG